MRQARRAKLLVATPRAVESLAGVAARRAVGSGKDRLEQVDPDTLDPPPKLIVTTAGKEGGTWQAGEQRKGRFEVAELPGPLVDAYGAGDTFAAGVTYALGAGYEIDDALAFAARAGAANLTGRGPYAGQLTATISDVRRPEPARPPRELLEHDSTTSSTGGSSSISAATERALAR